MRRKRHIGRYSSAQLPEGQSLSLNLGSGQSDLLQDRSSAPQGACPKCSGNAGTSRQTVFYARRFNQEVWRTSDAGGVMLCEAERRLGIAARLAGLFPDDRDGTRVIHRVSDMIRARIFAIACGYEDCNDFETLRCDPAFKLACGRRPDSDPDLASQPTLSRLENARRESATRSV
jgi:hypothetical protein